MEIECDKNRQNNQVSDDEREDDKQEYLLTI